MIDLKGKTAIVTGAARGLGFAIASKLASLNAHVVITDLNEEGASKAVDEIKDQGFSAEYILADVSDYNSANSLVEETIKKHGRLDILVNNAGINLDSMLHKLEPENWQKVIDVNLTGVYNMMKPASIHMRQEESGRIINISSLSWLGNIGQANYAAAKAGVVGLTKTASRELGRKNVTVNAICPGFIDTDMTRGVPDHVWDLMVSKISMGKAGKPEDVANCIAFLASEQAGYITGEVINVGGGMTL